MRQKMKKTEQMKFWQGQFGDEYTERNSNDFNKIYKERFGITRTDLNNKFLSKFKKETSMLEVGCNRGVQLNILKKMNFKNLWGIEINNKALNIAKEDKSMNIVYGSALDIPFKDSYFDIVFTSGVLIHISPTDLPKVIDEMYRTSKRYIWCYEYYSEKCKEIIYHDNKNRLWKNDFMNLFLKRHPDLKVVMAKKMDYIKQNNTDIMFLLEKKAKR
jgi:pseudaminic acid biosynthesis-associated methylase